MFCLWCHEKLIEKVSWQYLIGISTISQLCVRCDRKLEKISGELCDKCGRPFDKLQSLYRHGHLCYDCLSWKNGALLKNRSLYVYNTFLQELIAKWKYRGDAALVEIFSAPLQKLIRQFAHIDLLVPIPLAKDRLYERSFNQAKLLANSLPLPCEELLIKIKPSIKQSKQARQQRLSLEKGFQTQLPNSSYLQGKSIVLIDDIYTTGATLHGAAEILQAHGAKHIYSLTIARS